MARGYLSWILFNWTEIIMYLPFPIDFRLIWNQTDVLLGPSQSENIKYNLISVWFNKIPKKNSLCARGYLFWILLQQTLFGFAIYAFKWLICVYQTELRLVLNQTECVITFQIWFLTRFRKKNSYRRRHVQIGHYKHRKTKHFRRQFG